MKRKSFILIMIIIFSQIILGMNILENSSFNLPLSNNIPDTQGMVNTENSWVKFENSGGKGNVEIKNGKLIAVSQKNDAPEYGLQLIQAPLKLEAGGIYSVRFNISSNEKTSLTIKIGADGERAYYGYFQQIIEIDPNKKEYEFNFEMLAESDEKARFEFWFTQTDKPVEIDNVILEKIGMIETDRMINLVKFQVQHKYIVPQIGENLFSQKEIEKIKTLKNKEVFTKSSVLEEESNYLVEIDGDLKADEKYLISLNDKEVLELGKENKKGILKYNSESTARGEIQIKKIGDGKNLSTIKIEKYFGNLIWDETFDYEGLPKEEDWGYDVGGHGWGNHELQYYTEEDPDNVYVKDGKLIITAHKEKKGENDYTSTRLVTRGKKDFKYGRIEVRAKLPKGVGTWPAIWMMPTDSVYGDWPKSGEIDIMEHVGFDQNRIHGTLHTEKYYWKNSNQKSAQIVGENVSNSFHTYSIEWAPKIIKIYFDNILYFTYRNENKGRESWPFDQKFYLILNIAVGGAWGGQKGVDSSIFPQVLEIDSIKVYDLGIVEGN